MVGTSLQRGRTHGVDRPYIHVKTPRHRGRHHYRSPQGSWTPATGASPAPPSVPKDGAVARVSETHVPKDPTRSEPHSDATAVAASSTPAEIVHSCNLRNFLEAATPWVPAQYSSKGTINLRTMRSLQSRPYFNLADLWDSFKEWSAYGVGVPLVLHDSDKVVQYYVPFLSGIQLYGRSSRPSDHSRQLSLENGDCCDFISDGSNEKKNKGSENKRGGSSNKDDPVTTQGHLLFEFLEQDSPFIREPLSGKISGLAQRFPALNTLRSCDLLPCSWFSVAWYPIYRIPIGPTLKDLDACFLTFHFLSTPPQDHPGVRPGLTLVREFDSVHKMSLPIFGLASYKFRSSIWTRDGGNDLDVANSLVLDADNWLRLRHVELPDFQFFASRGASYLR